MRCHRGDGWAALLALVALLGACSDDTTTIPPDGGEPDQTLDTSPPDVKPAPDAPSCTSWVTTMGGTGDNSELSDDYTRALVVGPKDAIYVAGTYRGNLYVADKLETGTVGATDVYVVKLDSSGGVQWDAPIQGPAWDYVFHLDSDSSGNVATAGLFQQTATFGFGPAATTKTAKGECDGYVAGFSADGLPGPVETVAGTLDDWVGAVAFDKKDNLYIAGAFKGEATFGATTLKSTMTEALFVAKVTVPKGTTSSYGQAWVKTSPQGTGSIQIFDLVVDDQGNSYIAGYYKEGEPQLDAKLPKAEGEDVFVAKLDPGGTFLWSVTANGPESDRCWELALDGSGDIYAVGHLSASLTFTGGTKLTSAGDDDIWIAKLDGASGKVQWARSFGGTGTDSAHAVKLAPNGELFVAGAFTDKLTLGGGSKTCTLAGKGMKDAFVARLDSEAKACLAFATGGGTDDDHARAMDLDSQGNPIVAGDFKKLATFGGKTVTGRGTPVTQKGLRDVFVWKPCLK